MGIAPLTLKYNGGFAAGKYITVKAFPVNAGQYVQTKILDGSEILPRKIYFNMNLRPSPQQYEIDIQ